MVFLCYYAALFLTKLIMMKLNESPRAMALSTVLALIVALGIPLTSQAADTDEPTTEENSGSEAVDIGGITVVVPKDFLSTCEVDGPATPEELEEIRLKLQGLLDDGLRLTPEARTELEEEILQQELQTLRNKGSRLKEALRKIDYDMDDVEGSFASLFSIEQHAREALAIAEAIRDHGVQVSAADVTEWTNAEAKSVLAAARPSSGNTTANCSGQAGGLDIDTSDIEAPAERVSAEVPGSEIEDPECKQREHHYTYSYSHTCGEGGFSDLRREIGSIIGKLRGTVQAAQDKWMQVPTRRRSW